MENAVEIGGREVPFIFERSTTSTCRGSYVLTHGLGTSKNEYLDFYNRLSELLQQQGFNVLRFDFAGHGDAKESGRLFSLIRCFYEADAMTRYLCTELVEDNRVNFFGTSFGAGPAVFAAASFANTTERVTLLAPAIQYRELYIEPSSEARKTRYQSFLEDSLRDGTSIEIDDHVKFGWRNAVEFATINLEHQLSFISDRLSVFHGSEDEAIPIDLVRPFVQQLQRAKFIEIAGMEHGYTLLGDETGTAPESLTNLDVIASEACRAC
ncbi:MAG: alpha/beta fold hydrolase [Pseudomonadota bacterium]